MDTVTLTLKGNLMSVSPVTPRVESIVSDTASYMRRMAGGGKNAEYERQYLCSRDGDTLLTFSGLYDRLVAVLSKAGFAVQESVVERKELEADVSLLSESDLDNLESRDDQICVMGLVVDHPRNFIVDAPTGWGKSFIIAQLCQIMPKARIAVVSPGREVTTMLYNRIKERVRDVGQVGDGKSYISRITVCTAESMMKLRHIDWDLLLFDEVHRAGAPATSESISTVFKMAKCVGFSASPTGRTDGSDLVVEALFGPVIYKVNYATSAARGDITPIDVRMYRVDKGVGYTLGEEVMSVVRNRHYLWRNETRNALIAKIVGEIPADEQALIMTTTAEHALCLHKLLPDAGVIFSGASKKLVEKIFRGDYGAVPSGMDTTGSFTQEHRARMRAEFEQNKMKRAIATGIWNTGVDFKHLRWLIRADGMASAIQAIQTPGRLSRTADGKSTGILVDFNDAFDKALLGRSTQRIRQYKKNGWKISEIRDPDVCAPSFRDARK